MCAALSLCVSAQTASADGIDPLYEPDGHYIGDLELIGDVVDRAGVTYALFDVPALGLNLYIPPDAVYVLMDRNNPIIANQTRFQGYWIGYAPQSSGSWSPCDAGYELDHTGAFYRLYGDVALTNLDIAPSGVLSFRIDLGFCGGRMIPWGHSAAFFETAAHPPVVDPGWPSVEELLDICGNNRDLVTRALGCSQVIAHPQARIDEVAGAYWSRAYVRCGQLAPGDDVISDLMTAARLEPQIWQEFFQQRGYYGGPVDGVLSFDLLSAIEGYVLDGCR